MSRKFNCVLYQLLRKLDIGFDFVAPYIPSDCFPSGKKFNFGDVSHKLLNAGSCFLRLAAMFFNSANDDLMNICSKSFWIPPGCKQTYLCIASRPIPHPPKQGVGLSVFLDPDKCDGLVFKAPSFQNRKALFQHRQRSPHKHGAIFVCKIAYRKILISSIVIV